MPPTSGVITTPDVLIVKLVPDDAISSMCLFVVAGLLGFYVIQAVVAVSITCKLQLLTYTFNIFSRLRFDCVCENGSQ